MTAPIPPNCTLCGLLPGACQCTKESTEITRLWAVHNASEGQLDQIRNLARVVGTFWNTLVVEQSVDEDASTHLTGEFMRNSIGWAPDDFDADSEDDDGDA